SVLVFGRSHFCSRIHSALTIRSRVSFVRSFFFFARDYRCVLSEWLTIDTEASRRAVVRCMECWSGCLVVVVADQSATAHREMAGSKCHRVCVAPLDAWPLAVHGRRWWLNSWDSIRQIASRNERAHGASQATR